MDLGKLIELLSAIDAEIKVKNGFGNPHSWRGSYDELSFEPVKDTTIGEMLAAAESADGATYTGWKGGEYLMGLSSKVNIDFEGCYSDDSQIMNMFISLLADK